MTIRVAAKVGKLVAILSVAQATAWGAEADLKRLENNPKLKMSLTQMEDSDLMVSFAELTTVEKIPKAARRLYTKALKADEKGEESSAMDQLRAAVELAPQFFQAHAALAVGCLKTGEPEEAEHEIEMALQLNPYYLPGREIQAITWFIQGKFGAVVAALGAVAKLSPNHVLTHYYLGLALLKLGRPDEASRHLQEADNLLRNPPHPLGLNSDFERWDSFPSPSRSWDSCDSFNARRYPVPRASCGVH